MNEIQKPDSNIVRKTLTAGLAGLALAGGATKIGSTLEHNSEARQNAQITEVQKLIAEIAPQQAKKLDTMKVEYDLDDAQLYNIAKTADNAARALRNFPAVREAALNLHKHAVDIKDTDHNGIPNVSADINSIKNLQIQEMIACILSYESINTSEELQARNKELNFTNEEKSNIIGVAGRFGSDYTEIFTQVLNGTATDYAIFDFRSNYLRNLQTAERLVKQEESESSK